jgi:hypothetical protein
MAIDSKDKCRSRLRADNEGTGASYFPGVGISLNPQLNPIYPYGISKQSCIPGMYIGYRCLLGGSRTTAVYSACLMAYSRPATGTGYYSSYLNSKSS